MTLHAPHLDRRKSWVLGKTPRSSFCLNVMRVFTESELFPNLSTWLSHRILHLTTTFKSGPWIPTQELMSFSRYNSPLHEATWPCHDATPAINSQANIHTKLFGCKEQSIEHISCISLAYLQQSLLQNKMYVFLLLYILKVIIWLPNCTAALHVSSEWVNTA